MTKFETNRSDGRPLWRVIYDEITRRMTSGSLRINDLVDHGDLRRLLKRDEQNGYYQAIGRAARELEESHRRTLQRERGRGYRLCGGLGQAEKANGYRKRGQRNLSRALTVVTSVDHSLLNSEQSGKVDLQMRALGKLVSIAKMHDDKLAEHAEQLRELKEQAITRQVATEEEIADVRRRLSVLEGK